MTLRSKPNPDDLHTDEPTLLILQIRVVHVGRAIVGPDERMRRRLLAPFR